MREKFGAPIEKKDKLTMFIIRLVLIAAFTEFIVMFFNLN